jgi:hypothetical protein
VAPGGLASTHPGDVPIQSRISRTSTRAAYPTQAQLTRVGSRIADLVVDWVVTCVRQAMGRVGSCFDNAAAEALFPSLEWEVLSRHTFASTRQAQAVVLDWCYGFYNHDPRHSSANMMSPDSADCPRRRGSTPVSSWVHLGTSEMSSGLLARAGRLLSAAHF